MKTSLPNKTKKLRNSLVCLVLASTSFIAFNASAHDRYPPVPVYSRPAPVRFYDYVYYPSHQVYFSPRARTWYWSEGRHWRSGVRLPFGININLGGVPIQLRSALPYYDHVYVEQRYGRPWRSTHHDYYDYRDRRDFDDRYDRQDRYKRHHEHNRWDQR